MPSHPPLLPLVRPVPAGSIRLRRAVLNLLIFGLVFAVTATLIGRFVRTVRGATGDPTRRGAMVERAFEAQRDSVDAAFIGSSRFYRGVNPVAFDARLRELSGPEGSQPGERSFRSFNLSMNGMGMPEILERTRRLLEQNPARLRFLFLELNDLDPVYLERNRMGRRMISWHSARATLDSLRVLWGSDREFRAKWKETLDHLAEFSTRQSGRGSGPRVGLVLSGHAPPAIDAPGFVGYETREEQLAWGRAWKTAGGTVRSATVPSADGGEAQRHREEVEARRTATPRELPATQARMLTGIVSLCRSHGVEPIFVLAPVSGPNRLALIAERRGVLPTLFAYNVPKKHPELFQRVLFRDGSHYNDEGARVFSRRLAEDFVAWREGRRASADPAATEAPSAR